MPKIKIINKILSVYKSIWDKFLVLFAVIFVMIPNSPFISPYISRDSGVFLYTGWRILSGELPYRDIWDHKPPLIYYINALGQLIIRDSQWGVWLIEVFSLFIAAFIGFRIIKSALGNNSAIFTLFCWLLTLIVLNQTGNFTEEYALPLQFGCLWIVYKSMRHKFGYWRFILLGILIALSFFLKQTNVGLGCAIILYLSIVRIQSHKIIELLKEISYIFIGFFLITSVIFLFFTVQGAVTDFWKAAFQYNIVYIRTDFFSSFPSTISGLGYLAIGGLLEFSLIGIYFAIRTLIKKDPVNSNWKAIMIIGLLDLPIELLLVNTSGRAYEHYYIPMLPTLAIFSGLAFYEIFKIVKEKTKGVITINFYTIYLMAIILISSFRFYEKKIQFYSNTEYEYSNVVQIIQKMSSEDEAVLMWGAEAAYNFSAQRVSPSKFVYQYPLYTNGFVTQQMIEQFINDVIHNRPSLIIDTKNEFTPFLEFPLDSEEIEKGVSYLKMHYVMKEEIGGWTVYQYIKNP